MDAKTKIVSLRLSPREFAEIEQISLARGYHSVSLFARCAILAYGAVAPASDPPPDQLRALRERVEIIAAELSRIAARVAWSE